MGGYGAPQASDMRKNRRILLMVPEGLGGGWIDVDGRGDTPGEIVACGVGKSGLAAWKYGEIINLRQLASIDEVAAAVLGPLMRSGKASISRLASAGENSMPVSWGSYKGKSQSGSQLSA